MRAWGHARRAPPRPAVRRHPARAARLPARVDRARDRRPRGRRRRGRPAGRGGRRRGPGPHGVGHGRRLDRGLAPPPARRRDVVRRRGGAVGGARAGALRALRGAPRCSTRATRPASHRCRARCWRSLPGRWPATSGCGRAGRCRTRGSTSWRFDHEPLPAGRALGAPPLLRVRLVRHRLSGRPPAHHHSLSSLPSIARRCVREQVSQKARRRPFSTAVVQVRVSASGACVPQNVARDGVAHAGRRLLRNAPGRPRAGYDVTVTSYPARAVRLTRDQGESGPDDGDRSDQIARARARRACCAACSALRLMRRARASWWPRRISLRLSQARGHLCAREFFVHEIHVVASISVGLHEMCGSCTSSVGRR